MTSTAQLESDVVFIGSEQPESCRWCGVRTIFDELGDGMQRHECPACKAWYLVEFE